MVLTGYTRKSWEDLFLELWKPLYHRFSPDRAYVHLKGPQLSTSGPIGDGYEGFARTFIGAAYFLHHRDNGQISLEGQHQIDIASIYRQGIINGTNPHHKAYWGTIKSAQKLAENCSVAIGLLLTKRHIWDRLASAEKQNIANWFKLNSAAKYYPNNWQWFKVFHYIFLERMGYEINSNDLKETLDGIDKMYIGEGCYSDGINNGHVFDYYNAWAMHYYALLFCYLASDKYDSRKAVYLERAKQFLDHYRYFFSPGSVPPLFGRSQVYRWASLAPWGPAVLTGCCETDYGWLKTITADTINEFIKKEALNDNGLLSMGYFKECLPILEPYSSPASPYWAFKAFGLLLLREDHPFWKQEPGTILPPENPVHPIRPLGILLSHSEDSHVILLTTGISARDIPDYNIKYNKFAYSNRFLPNYHKYEPVDNMLLLKSGLQRWKARRIVFNRRCEEKICEMTWSPSGMKNVVIKTILIGRPNGYIAVHQLQKGERVHYYTGGFPITGQNLLKKQQENELVIYDTERQTGIKLLTGNGILLIKTASGKNPGGKYSQIPCIKGRFVSPEDILVLAIWAGKPGCEFKIPSIIKNGRIQVKFTDTENIAIN